MATTKVNVSKISDFPKVTPAGSDYILVEKDGQGGSITLSQIPVSTPVSTRIADEVNTLNSRIDNIVASSGDDISEIVDARQGSDGTNYASLRARLDAENNQLKGDLGDVEDRIAPIDFRQKSIGKVTLNIDVTNTMQAFMDGMEKEPNEAIALTLEPDVPTADSHNFGVRGQICIDSNYLYVCVSNNTWKKITLLDL